MQFKKGLVKAVAVVSAVAITAFMPAVGWGDIAPKASAASYSQLQQRSKQISNELAQLKKDKASQQELKKKLEEQIANTQAQINDCNARLRKYSAQIDKCQAQINEKEAEIKDTKAEFRKRMRSIYMSGNTSGDLVVLLNSESVSDYLTMAQLSVNTSNRDKKLVNTIVNTVNEIEANKKQIETEKANQQSVQADLKAKQDSLNSQSNEIASVISKIDSSTDKLTEEQHSLQADMKTILDAMNSNKNTGSGSGNNNGGSIVNKTVYEGTLKWPVPGYTNLSSGFGQRWGTTHKGIDIAGSGIMGKPIIAVGDGVILKSGNSCTHNYKKNGSCGCGGGYGNYAYLNVNANGVSYTLVYGHMSQCIVSAGQQVKAGQVIGYVGTTGWSTGPHLHYEVWKNGQNINPMSIY